MWKDLEQCIIDIEVDECRHRLTAYVSHLRNVTLWQRWHCFFSSWQRWWQHFEPSNSVNLSLKQLPLLTICWRLFSSNCENVGSRLVLYNSRQRPRIWRVSVETSLDQDFCFENSTPVRKWNWSDRECVGNASTTTMMMHAVWNRCR